MAIYHFSASVISRGAGRSAIAAAAYRSAEKLYDERLDHSHDFTKKNDVLHSEILSPEGAPDWMQDRETLWNAVEKAERRKDAQLAREITIAFAERINACTELGVSQSLCPAGRFVDKGMVADVNFIVAIKGVKTNRICMLC